MTFDQIIAQPAAHPQGGASLWLQFGDDEFWVDACTRIVSGQFAVVFDDVMFAAESVVRRHGHELAGRVTVLWLGVSEPLPGPFYEPRREALERCRGRWEVARSGSGDGYRRRGWRVARRPRGARLSERSGTASAVSY